MRFALVVALALARAAGAPAFDAAAALARFEEVERWWLARGDVAAPAWWGVRSVGDLARQPEELAHGISKQAWLTATRDGGDAVLKAARGAKHRRFDDVYTEILYLEYCRGRPGVPALLGAWFVAGKAYYVVADAGATIDGDAAYAAAVAAAPLAVARAWLRLGEAFAETCGYLEVDFKPAQFSLKDGVVSLVDGPRPATGPVYAYLSRQDRFKSPRGLGAAGAACHGGDQAARCRTTTAIHCCCAVHGAPGPLHVEACGGAAGAPESVGRCARRRCAPITAKTHVWDFANRPWIFGALVDAAAGDDAALLRRLQRNMSAPNPDDRPTFADALAALS